MFSRKYFYLLSPSLVLALGLTKLFARFFVKLAQVPLMPVLHILSSNPLPIFRPIATHSLQPQQPGTCLHRERDSERATQRTTSQQDCPHHHSQDRSGPLRYSVGKDWRSFPEESRYAHGCKTRRWGKVAYPYRCPPEICWQHLCSMSKHPCIQFSSGSQTPQRGPWMAPVSCITRSASWPETDLVIHSARLHRCWNPLVARTHLRSIHVSCSCLQPGTFARRSFLANHAFRVFGPPSLPHPASLPPTLPCTKWKLCLSHNAVADNRQLQAASYVLSFIGLLSPRPLYAIFESPLHDATQQAKPAGSCCRQRWWAWSWRSVDPFATALLPHQPCYPSSRTSRTTRLNL